LVANRRPTILRRVVIDAGVTRSRRLIGGPLVEGADAADALWSSHRRPTPKDTMEGPTEPARDRGSTSRGEPADVPSETPRSGRRRLIELSHQIHHGMITYPGLPGPELSDYLPREASPARYGPGTEFHIGRISMVANTGTYLDSPFHRFAGATDVAGLPLQRVADLDGVVVRIGVGRREIDRDAFASYEVGGRAVLVHTGWDRYWATERYGTGNPFLTAAAADWLVEQQAGLVGIDSVNIDDTSGPARPVHTALLAAGIPIVEHLCGLDQLPPSGFRFHAAPPQVVGIGTFPVRAYAVLADG
jgi:arylformamidase